VTKETSSALRPALIAALLLLLLLGGAALFWLAKP
jgi:hypothetical protein